MISATVHRDIARGDERLTQLTDDNHDEPPAGLFTKMQDSTQCEDTYNWTSYYEDFDLKALAPYSPATDAQTYPKTTTSPPLTIQNLTVQAWATDGQAPISANKDYISVQHQQPMKTPSISHTPRTTHTCPPLHTFTVPLDS